MTLLTDLRLAVRRVVRNRAISAFVVLTLSCAIGASTLVFSLVNGVLLHPLPYRDPERLVTIRRILQGFEGINQTIPYADYEAWRTGTGVFVDVAGVTGWQVELRPAGRPACVARAGWVTANFFEVLGPRLVLGRGFVPADHRPGHIQAAVLTEEFWRSHFGGDAQVIGTRLTVLDTWVPEYSDFVIVGVVSAPMRGSADSNSRIGLLLPCPSPPSGTFVVPALSSAFSPLVGRLKEGVSVQRASGAVARFAVAQGFRRLSPHIRDRRVIGGEVAPLHEWEFGSTREGFTILTVGVALVLVTACINLGALLLAAGLRRVHELAVRAVMGAGYWRLTRELLLEHFVLALAGGIGGLALAALCLPVLLAVVPSNLPRVGEVALDGMSLAVAALVTAASVLIFGVVPASVLSRRSLGHQLRVRAITAAERRRLGRELVVGIQIALTLVLLTGSFLVGRSLWNLATVPLGFEPHGVVTASLSLDSFSSRVRDEKDKAAFQRRLLDQVREMPGVESAALVFKGDSTGVHVPGVEGDPLSGGYIFMYNAFVTPEYFAVLRMPLRRGRPLVDQDADTSVVVNESFARRYFLGADPVGHWMESAGWHRIVGVVADARDQSATRPAGPAVYRPLGGYGTSATLVVRARTGTATVERALSDLIMRLDAGVPFTIASMDAQLSAQRAPTRFYVVLLSTFAGFGLLLAAGGVFTLTYYAVNERTHEFGVRLALGAQPQQIRRAVRRRVLRITAPSLLAGVLLWVAASRMLESVLYGVTRTDTSTIAVACLLVTSLAILASHGPARRAGSLDPATTLRAE